MASRSSGSSETPYLVVIGVPDKPALEAIIERLNRYGIDHEAFYEPDNDMGLSAVATIPITNKKHRRAMFIYKTWTPQEECVQ